jgi:hypothetical protein
MDDLGKKICLQKRHLRVERTVEHENFDLSHILRRTSEAIAESSDGLDVSPVAGFAQNLSQALHVHINRSLVHVTVVSPNLSEQLGAIESPPRVRHQELEQAIFDPSQVEGLAARGHAIGGGLQHQFIAIERGLLMFQRVRAQYGGDARDHLSERGARARRTP